MVGNVNDSDFSILKLNLQFVPADIRSVYDVMHIVPPASLIAVGWESLCDYPSSTYSMKTMRRSFFVGMRS
jgi:hypothetical protein